MVWQMIHGISVMCWTFPSNETLFAVDDSFKGTPTKRMYTPSKYVVKNKYLKNADPF